MALNTVHNQFLKRKFNHFLFLRKRIGAWCSPTNDVTRSTLQMVTVDLGLAKRITYIATQGRDKYFERVSQFKVS